MSSVLPDCGFSCWPSSNEKNYEKEKQSELVVPEATVWGLSVSPFFCFFFEEIEKEPDLEQVEVGEEAKVEAVVFSLSMSGEPIDVENKEYFHSVTQRIAMIKNYHPCKVSLLHQETKIKDEEEYQTVITAGGRIQIGVVLQPLPENITAEAFMECMNEVKKNGKDLEHASPELRGDRDIVLAAVKQNGDALKYASDELQKDPEIVVAAFKQKLLTTEQDKAPELLRNAGDIVRSNQACVLAAVKLNGLALKHADSKLSENRDVVLAAVRQTEWALEYASAELRADREVVLEALKQGNGRVLKYVLGDLRGDRAIVLKAVRRNGDALEFAAPELRGAREVVIEAFKQKLRTTTEQDKIPELLQNANDIVKRHQACVLAAVKRNGMALEYASEALKKDPKVVLAAVIQNGLALRHASLALRRNPWIVLAAVQQDEKKASWVLDLYARDTFLFGWIYSSLRFWYGGYKV